MTTVSMIAAMLALVLLMVKVSQLERQLNKYKLAIFALYEGRGEFVDGPDDTFTIRWRNQ